MWFHLMKTSKTVLFVNCICIVQLKKKSVTAELYVYMVYDGFGV